MMVVMVVMVVLAQLLKEHHQRKPVLPAAFIGAVKGPGALNTIVPFGFKNHEPFGRYGTQHFLQVRKFGFRSAHKNLLADMLHFLFDGPLGLKELTGTEGYYSLYHRISGSCKQAQRSGI